MHVIISISNVTEIIKKPKSKNIYSLLWFTAAKSQVFVEAVQSQWSKIGR